MYNDKKKMSDRELSYVLSGKIEQSNNYWVGNYAEYRLQARRYYEGDPFGNEIEGRSSVVSRDVAEAIDTEMAGLMNIFEGSEDVVRFEPVRPEDEKLAEQVTNYVNFIWNKRNQGYKVSYEWMKAALLDRLGIIKIYWEDHDTVREESYEGLTEEEYDALKYDPDIKIVKKSSYTDPQAEAAEAAAEEFASDIEDALEQETGEEVEAEVVGDLPKLYDVTVRYTDTQGQVKVSLVPPEEFIFDEWTTSLEDAEFVAHRRTVTMSELRKMGYSEAKIKEVEKAQSDEYYWQEKRERHDSETEFPYENDALHDETLAKVFLTECYLNIDFDGDGIAEYRRIVVGGETMYTVFENEVVDDNPFAVLTPVLMPFKMVGQSIADQTMDLQLIKSTLWRQSLDNFYLTNHQRYAINDNVNLDDLLSPRPGQPVRTQNPSADIVPLNTQPMAQEALGMIEYVDTVREHRTGITRYNQGMDADTLNKTATGIKQIQQAGNQRMELIARTFAETGFKTAFRKIYDLLVKYQPREEMIRLNNEWVRMDPREWTTRFDVTVQVGLGTGDKDKEIQQAQMLSQMMEKIVSFQGNAFGPLVTVENVYQMFLHLSKTMGVDAAQKFITNPATMPPEMLQPPQQQQSSESDAYLKAEQMKAQQQEMESQRDYQLDLQKMQFEQQLEREKMEREFALKERELQMKYPAAGNITRGDAEF